MDIVRRLSERIRTHGNRWKNCAAFIISIIISSKIIKMMRSGSEKSCVPTGLCWVETQKSKEEKRYKLNAFEIYLTLEDREVWKMRETEEEEKLNFVGRMNFARYSNRRDVERSGVLQLMDDRCAWRYIVRMWTNERSLMRQL